MDQVPFSQISPYGKTVDGMTQPVSDEELNIFSGNNKDAYSNNLKAAVEEYGDFQSMGYTLQDLETTPGLKDWFKIHKRNKDNNQLELEAAAAKSKAEAEAYEAEQNRIRQAALEAQRVQAAQAKAQAEAQARAKAQAEAQARAKAAAAEKERQAAAAQKRMNDRYETGPVARAPTPAARPSAPAGGYSTKQRNNNFAVRRDIRNIFA
jgi:DNA polymerase III alpha subunit (gram-positive type)